MSYVETAGAARGAAEKKSLSVIMSFRERLAVWMSLPTVEYCAFCAMTRCTGARRRTGRVGRPSRGLWSQWLGGVRRWSRSLARIYQLIRS